MRSNIVLVGGFLALLTASAVLIAASTLLITGLIR